VTLVLSLLAPDFVLQVSDRLVSKRSQRVDLFEDHDVLANKTLVYLAPDGRFAISYSGAAYIGGIPTDEWVARVITGINPPHPWHGMKFGTVPRRLDIGRTAILLAANLQHAFERLPPAHREQPIWIVIVGWKHRRSRPDIRITVAWAVEKGRCTARARAGPLLHRDDDDPYHLFMTGAGVPEELASSLLERIDEEDADPAACERLLLGLIRQRATPGSGIGRDCMSVLLPPFSAPEVVYRPAVDRLLPVIPIEEPVPVAFAPWLIGSRAVVSPQAFAGSGAVIPVGSEVVSRSGENSEVCIRLDGPRVPGVRFAASTAPRKAAS
jgi:hypothetical protein